MWGPPVANILEPLLFSLLVHCEDVKHREGVLAVSVSMCLLQVGLHHLRGGGGSLQPGCLMGWTLLTLKWAWSGSRGSMRQCRLLYCLSERCSEESSWPDSTFMATSMSPRAWGWEVGHHEHCQWPRRPEAQPHLKEIQLLLHFRHGAKNGRPSHPAPTATCT